MGGSFVNNLKIKDSIKIYSGISVIGAANALSSVHDIVRARYVLEVVAACLHKLILHAHRESNSELPWEQWVEKIAEENSNAFYWLLVLKFQKLILIFITAQRLGNFKLYVAALQEVMKFIFILDHIHYSRWLSVHIFDLLCLENIAPDVLTEFLKGKFVVTKSEILHSSIAIDQAHEQHNAIIKSTSGGMELLNRDDDGKALLRTTVSLPELVRMREEYECLTSTKTPESSKEHHEAYSAFQKCFYKDVQNLFDSFNSSFNPFIVQNSPLLSYVNSGDIMDNCIELDRSLRSMEFKGQQLYEEFVKQRIVECTVQITNPINKNNILLPSNVEKQGPADFVTLTAKEDRKLLMGLKTIAPIRKDATILALEYEPGNVPPVFTMRGKLYQSPKSNLLGRMRKLDEDQNTQTTENVVADNESTISSEIYKQLIVDLSMVTVKLYHISQ